MNIGNLQKQSNCRAGKIPKKCKKSIFYSEKINFESPEEKNYFLIPSVNLWNIDSGKYSTCLVLFEYLHFILDLEARFSHSYSNWGGGANNSFLWRSKTRRHKEPFCLPNFGELAKANLSPQKFFIPPPSYLIAHSYISQVFPLACSFLGFHRLSKFLLWDIIIIFCHHLGFKNLSKAKKYPEFFFFY